jgi:hypothetical protein
MSCTPVHGGALVRRAMELPGQQVPSTKGLQIQDGRMELA